MTSKEYFGYFSQEMQNRGGCITNPVMLVVLLLVVMFLFGCKTYVPVPECHTEYVYRTDSVTLRDSIWQHDSVYVSMKGDTITVEKWRTKYVEHLRDVVKIDSFIKTDSIRVPYPVERKLGKWEQIKMDYGAVSIGVSIAAVIAAIVALVLWLRKRSLLKG